jgi:hypothetical protein
LAAFFSSIKRVLIVSNNIKKAKRGKKNTELREISNASSPYFPSIKRVLILSNNIKKAERGKKNTELRKISNVWSPSFSSIKPVLIVSNNMKRACSLRTDVVSERALGFWDRADPVVAAEPKLFPEKNLHRKRKINRNWEFGSNREAPHK